MNKWVAAGWLIAIVLAVLLSHTGISMLIALLMPADPILASALSGLLVFGLVLTVRTLRPTWFAYGSVRAPAASHRVPVLQSAGTLLIVFLAAQVLSLWVYANGGSNSYQGAQQAFDAAPPVLLLSLTLVIAPLAEEAVYRGVLYPLLRRKLPIGICAATSALVFGYMHGNFVQMAVAIPLGFFAALLYEQTRSLWAPVIMHALFNLMATVTPVAVLAALAQNTLIVAVLQVAAAAALWGFWKQVVKVPDLNPVTGRQSAVQRSPGKK